jgi:hypothetical protein
MFDATSPLVGEVERVCRATIFQQCFRQGDFASQLESGQEAREAVITIRIRSAALRAPSFFMTLAR